MLDIKKLDQEIEQVEKLFLEMQTNSLEKSVLTSEWTNISSLLEKSVFPIIDEAADEIERTEDAQYLKQLFRLYQKGYRLTAIALNYGRVRLADKLNSSEKTRPRNPYQDFLPRRGERAYGRTVAIKSGIVRIENREIPANGWDPPR
jgi:hypothetical protein